MKCFWDYARQTLFYEEIIYRKIEKSILNSTINNYVFPYEKIPHGSNIVLYGAAEVGTAFMQQICLTRYCNVCLWCDKNYQHFYGTNTPVKNPEDLSKTKFDFVVIAVESEGVMDEIRTYLKRIGVADEKIVWEKPLQ